MPFLREYVVTAATSADLLELGVPEIADNFSVIEKFRTTTKSAGREKLRKHLRSGSKKTTTDRVFPKNFKTNQLVAKRPIFKHFSLIISSKLWCHFFKAVYGNLGGKVPVIDDVLSSHERKKDLTTSWHENYTAFKFQTDRIY